MMHEFVLCQVCQSCKLPECWMLGYRAAAGVQWHKYLPCTAAGMLNQVSKLACEVLGICKSSLVY